MIYMYIPHRTWRTAGRAALVRKQYPSIHAVGGITLNNSVGGLNPMAIEMAARMGAKIVWFPTVNSLHQKKYLERTGEARPYGSGGASAVEIKDIPVLTDGHLVEGVFEVLDTIKQFHLTLATGHIAPEEALALIRAGHDIGLTDMIATHVSFPMTSFSVELQKECISLGAVVEHCYYTPYSTPVSIESICEQIRSVGCGNVLLSTDMGQTTSPDPVEGLADFANLLMEKGGFSTSEVRHMLCDVPARLVE